MLPDFMQSLHFALIQLVRSYSKSYFYQKQFLFSLSILYMKAAWSIQNLIGLEILVPLHGHVHPPGS